MAEEWRHRPRFWTDDRIAILKAEYPAGTHIDDIAKLIGCTRDAAHRKAVRLKLPRKPSLRSSRKKAKEKAPRKYHPKGFWTVERVLYLVDAYDRGQHVLAIATCLGCTKGAVVGKANRLGLEHPNAGLGAIWTINSRAAKWDKWRKAA